ncbi:MAG: MopE-related protein [Candidatus Woesearchaeota archaeon]|nr:MopE-related protein [Candidatus Woesearchaeota archaeon]
MREKTLPFIATIFGIFILVSAFALATQTINTKPEINVTFDEEVNVVLANLTNIPYTALYPLTLVSSKDNVQFNYKPNSDLPMGNYLFSIVYKDLIGNSNTSSIEFTVVRCLDNDNDEYNGSGANCGPVDCDDSNFRVYPGAVEVCGNNIDEDCSGSDLKCPVTLSKIEISPKSAVIVKGQEFQFEINAVYSDGKRKPIENLATLSSDSPSVSVVALNKIKGVSEGIAKVTASYSEGSIIKTDDATVKVNATEDYSFSYLKIMPVQITIEVNKSYCSVFDVFLCDATRCDYSWDYELVSDKPSVVNITAPYAGWAKTCIDGKSAGIANVRAKSGTLTSDNSASVEVVSNGTVSKFFVIEPKENEIEVGETLEFNGYICSAPEYYSCNITESAVFSSTNPSVAAKVSGGEFLGVSEGLATITAEYNEEGNAFRDSAQLRVIPPPFITLINPATIPGNRYTGYANSTKFELMIATYSEANCIYSLTRTNYGTLLNKKQFERNDDGKFHTAADFNLTSNKNVYVVCTDLSGKNYTETFTLNLLVNPPKINSAYATSVYEADNYGMLNTYMYASTDIEAICRYDDVATEYDDMRYSFDGEDEINYYSFKEYHSIYLQNLEDENDYGYYVRCRGKSGLLSELATVNFRVDTRAAPDFRIDSPKECIQGSFKYNIVTNKRARECYAGKTSEIIDTYLSKNTSYNFISYGSISNSNTTTYYIGCIFEYEQMAVDKQIEVTTDLIKPKMIYVDDNSGIPGRNEESPYLDQLRVKFNGEDSGCGLDYFVLQVFDSSTKKNVSRELNYPASDAARALMMTGLSLADNKTYFIRAYAVDKAGWKSVSNDSNGVKINSTIKVENCSNGIIDGLESDVDCGGGKCNACSLNKSCNIHYDCISLSCNSTTKRCMNATCFDGAKNGNESDIDCGGLCDKKCDIGKKCSENSDCRSGKCSSSTGKCEEKDSCKNKIQDLTETDIDCGGECSPCKEGKACEDIKDCEEGLSCLDNTCSIDEKDSDNDGVPDTIDKCKDTKSGTKVDSTGCPYDSDNDGMPDKWEKDNGLDPNDPTDAEKDNDNDGLTNREEYENGTDPNNSDTDGDGYSDKWEIDNGFDPLDPESHPKKSSWWLILLLILLILFGGIGLYLYYTKSNKKPKKSSSDAQFQFENTGIENPPFGGISQEMEGKDKEMPGAMEGSSLTPDMIARIKSKVREQERKKLFENFEQKEGNKPSEEEKPIEEIGKNPEESDEETKPLKPDKVTFLEKAPKNRDERDVFLELEKLAGKGKKNDVFEDLKKIAKGKKNKKEKSSGKKSGNKKRR